MITKPLKIVAGFCLGLLWTVSLAMAQVSGNASLSGRYFFRQVLFATDAAGTVTDTRSATGTLTFDANGGFTITGQQLLGAAVPAVLSGNGTYLVKPGGFMTMSNPLRSGATMTARLGVGAVTASTTENGTVFDVLIAVQAPPAPVNASLLSGTYYLSTLEFDKGLLSNVRNTFSPLVANGSGSFGNPNITGQAANLSGRLTMQPVTAASYSINADGQGTVNFPGSASDPSTLLLTGVKAIAVAPDGSYFVGGSVQANGHGLLVGVKASPSGGSNSSWNGFFFGTGMRVDSGKLSAFSGTAFSTGSGNATWARRLRQLDAALDVAVLHPYGLVADGSGTALGNRIAIASTGNTFAGSGVQISDAPGYELFFGVRIPAQSGAGVFINPQGALNAASFAPPGYPVAPGSFVSLFGTGFGATTGTSGIPYQKIVAGVSLTVNGIPAAIYQVLNGRVDFFIPYGATGSVATVVMTSNGTKSNSIDLPLAASAPGVFSLLQNGLGPGAILHADFTIVTAQNPAKVGEVVQVFLVGLGATNPAVGDGIAPPNTPPLAAVPAPLQVFVGGVAVTNVLYQGLAPGLPGLYQLNIQIPVGVASGQVPLALLTGQAFTDMVDIMVQ